MTAGANAAAAIPPSDRHSTSTGSDGASAAPREQTAVPSRAAQYTRLRTQPVPDPPGQRHRRREREEESDDDEDAATESGVEFVRIAFSGTLTMLLLTVPTNVPASSAASAGDVPGPCSSLAVALRA